jgi:hypothetical protein
VSHHLGSIALRRPEGAPLHIGPDTRGAQAPELWTAGDGMQAAAAWQMAQDSILDSIDPDVLVAVTGGGLSLGDRNPPPENPNSWAEPTDRAATAMSNGYKGMIDPGMWRMPENPNMDSGIWQQPPLGGFGDSSTSAPLDI